MSDIIARGHKLSERLFPPVNSNFYNTDQYAQLNPKQQASLKVLDLANSKINPWSCFFGRQSKVPVGSGLWSGANILTSRQRW